MRSPSLPAWDESRVTDADEQIVISHNWAELRHFMWDYVGIVRTNKRLQRAQHRIQLLQDEISEYYANFHISSDLLELRNLVLNAELDRAKRLVAPRKSRPAFQQGLSGAARKSPAYHPLSKPRPQSFSARHRIDASPG